MDFSHSKPRRQSEPALPMINVVFLLLIFFLMSAQVVVPPPFEVTLPTAATDQKPTDDLRLYISSDAALALIGTGDADVWTTLENWPGLQETSLLIQADAALPAAALARVLARLSDLGFERIQLSTAPK